MSDHIRLDITASGVATITLNRPDKRNAFSSKTISELIAALDSLSNQRNVRCLIVQGEGKHFSAGADLAWMKSMANNSREENIQDAKRLALLLSSLDNMPMPTIAVVQGCAFGGALGLLCCCDIVIGEESSLCCFSEVKIGLIPATIAPYVVRAIGIRMARRYLLTAETITGKQALELGIFHELTQDGSSEFVAADIAKQILSSSPSAIRNTKSLIKKCHFHIEDPLINHTAELIADARVSKDGQHGLQSFFSKTTPDWVWKE